MKEIKKSPKILKIVWGEMEIENIGKGKDFKLYPGGGREWDWNETKTKHVPGIQPSDVKELIDNGAKIIILSRGMQLVLQTCPETIDLLKQNGLKVYIEETKAAVALYNKLAENEPVGGLFHSTC